MSQMGQELFNPPNVAGWHGGSSWLTSGTWLARLNLANYVASGAGQHAPGAARAMSAGTNVEALLQGVGSPRDAVARLADMLLDGQISSDQRNVLADYLTAPD